MSRSSLKNVARLIDISNEDKPVNEMFLSDLKRSIEITDERGAGKKASQTFKPSSMQCKRNSYYQLMGVQQDKGKPRAYNMSGIVQAGSDAHVYLQKCIMQMKDNGINVEWVDVEDYVKSHRLDDLEIKSKTETETKLYNKKYNMSFMCDGIIRYKDKYYVVEIKTEMSSKWFSRTNVDKKHYNQAISYSLCFGIDEVLFLYMSRDNSEMKCFQYVVDATMKSGLIDYIDDVNGYVERKIAPPKLEDDKRVCTYCAYAMQCKKDG